VKRGVRLLSENLEVSNRPLAGPADSRLTGGAICRVGTFCVPTDATLETGDIWTGAFHGGMLTRLNAWAQRACPPYACSYDLEEPILYSGKYPDTMTERSPCQIKATADSWNYKLPVPINARRITNDEGRVAAVVVLQFVFQPINKCVTHFIRKAIKLRPFFTTGNTFVVSAESF
jgi:hypothetical protein